MSKVNYHLLGDSVVINHKARTTVIRRGDSRFDAVIDCIRDSETNPDRLNDIPDLIDTEGAYSKKGLVLKNGLFHLNDEPLPEELSKRLITLVEMKLPTDPLLKFWINLKDNPSFNSRRMLYKFLEHNGHPLTQDGCFIAYRGVTEDFKDVHTKQFNNSVGSVCEIPRSQVDDNPNNTCSHGLHVACYEYANGFGKRLVEVKVNPKDVVTVPVDYNGTKMRVCKFEVVAECEQLREEPIYNYSGDLDFEEDNSYLSDGYSEDDYYSSNDN